MSAVHPVNVRSQPASAAPDSGAGVANQYGAASATRRKRGEHEVFAPLMLLTIAMLLWLAFQSWQLVSERQQLQQLREDQAQLVRNATVFRARLDRVASETQRLADSGNPNARLLVDELRKRGITISPNSASTATPGS